MRGLAKLLAVLLLALGPVALTSVTPAQADPRGRDERGERGKRGGEGRQAERRGGGDRDRGGDRGQAYPAPVYRGPAPPYGGGYAPYPAYPSGPVYGEPPPGAYAYAPPPGYVPNSLGADWGQQQDQARRGVRQGRMMPLGQVMQLIKRRTPGRLLDAGLEPGPDGRPAYRVRWAATGGRRIDFIVDAVTGTILARTGY
jgi:hypothetical protein